RPATGAGRAARRGGPPLPDERPLPAGRLWQPGAVALAVAAGPPRVAPPPPPQAPRGAKGRGRDGRRAPAPVARAPPPRRTGEGPLHLSNVHLGLAEKERHWQVNHLLHHPLFRESLHLPTLIVGDWNDWRNTLAAGPLARWDFEQVTGPPSHFRSFPAFMTML